MISVLLKFFTQTNLWPFVAIATSVIFALLALGNTSWYVYVLLAFVFAERAMLQLRLLIGRIITKLAMQEMQERILKAQQQSQMSQMPEFPPPNIEGLE